MNKRQKVELFEEIRREYRQGVGTIQGVARPVFEDAPPPQPLRPARRKTVQASSASTTFLLDRTTYGTPPPPLENSAFVSLSSNSATSSLLHRSGFSYIKLSWVPSNPPRPYLADANRPGRPSQLNKHVVLHKVSGASLLNSPQLRFVCEDVR